MKKIFLVAAILITSLSADVYVNGYYKSNGTYVKPHYRSNPDGYLYNNKSYNKTSSQNRGIYY